MEQTQSVDLASSPARLDDVAPLIMAQRGDGFQRPCLLFTLQTGAKRREWGDNYQELLLVSFPDSLRVARIRHLDILKHIEASGHASQ